MNATLAKLAAMILSACALAGGNAQAAEVFSVQRGISMDQWVSWPDPEKWTEDYYIDAFPEWQNFVEDSELVHLKTAGFDTVRLPLDPAMFLYKSTPQRTARLLASIDRAIDRLRAAELNVIVDLHTIPRGDGEPAVGNKQIVDDPALFAAYLDLVSQTAKHLQGRAPSHIALELMNEPVLDCTERADNEKWHLMAKQMHAAARSQNRDVTLLLSGACWGTAQGLTKMDPSVVGDTNIIWTFHHYEPFKLTHQSATWAGPWVEHLANIPYPPYGLTQAQARALVSENQARIYDALSGKQANDMAEAVRYDIDRLRQPAILASEMRQAFDQAAQWADRYGIARDRIFMGEFGMIRQEWEREAATRPEWRIAYIRDMIALAEEQGFGWSLWSFGSAFGLMQGFGGEKLNPPLVDAILADGVN